MRGFLMAVCLLGFAACNDESAELPIPSEPSVSVAKHRGTIQCYPGGSSLQELQLQLVAAGIRVLSSSCGGDGRAYPAMCGAPTGEIGVFGVPESQVLSALDLGFVLLSSLPDASSFPCLK